MQGLGDIHEFSVPGKAPRDQRKIPAAARKKTGRHCGAAQHIPWATTKFPGTGGYATGTGMPLPGKLDVFFYEAFAEEARVLKRLLPPGVRAGFSRLTIQECGHQHPPCSFISIRTQSKIRGRLGRESRGISPGVPATTTSHPFSGKPARASRRIPAQLLQPRRGRAGPGTVDGALRRLPKQVRQFAGFDRDGLTGSECLGKTLLVAGVGNIGSEYLPPGRGARHGGAGSRHRKAHEGLRYVDLEEGVKLANVIRVRHEPHAGRTAVS